MASAVLFAAVMQGCVILNPTEPYVGMTQHEWNEHKPVSRPTTQEKSEPITLAKAIEIALANNPELAAVGCEVNEADAARDEAFGAMLPTVSGKSGYDQYLDRHRLGPPRYTREPRTFSDGVFSSHIVLNMPLFTGGRLINQFRAAELLQVASEHRLARTREELVFDVSSVFFSILAQKHVIESLEFSQQTLKEHLKRISELIHAQKAAKVDSLRTEVRIADLEQQLVKERNIMVIQDRVLMNLLGVAHEGIDPIHVVGELTIGGENETSVEAGIAKAFAQRGDYLAARAALDAQTKRVDAARAGHWPSLAVRGNYGGLWAVDDVDRDGDSSFDDVGSVGLVVDIPIFEGGRIDARIRLEQAKLSAAQERLRKFELQVRKDVETAHLNVSSAFHRVKATEKSIEQAKESLRIEREKYNLAKGAITDVLDAQSALLDSQMNYYQALADYQTSLSEYRLAVGETP
ncbi:MAG: TolC family protein [Candidatus Omnitrophica bacterium]|nr:TolC family protein [Candidatus Omnitrophota bacterium]